MLTVLLMVNGIRVETSHNYSVGEVGGAKGTGGVALEG